MEVEIYGGLALGSMNVTVHNRLEKVVRTELEPDKSNSLISFHIDYGLRDYDHLLLVTVVLVSKPVFVEPIERSVGHCNKLTHVEVRELRDIFYGWICEEHGFVWV